jgi:hypothetical protein
VRWSTIGKPADSYRIAIDGKPAADQILGCEAELSLAGLSKGAHVLRVSAVGAVTRHPLSWTEMDTPLETPAPLVVELPFTLL